MGAHHSTTSHTHNQDSIMMNKFVVTTVMLVATLTFISSGVFAAPSPRNRNDVIGNNNWYLSLGGYFKIRGDDNSIFQCRDLRHGATKCTSYCRSCGGTHNYVHGVDEADCGITGNGNTRNCPGGTAVNINIRGNSNVVCQC